ncbi:SLC13 family permease [Mammaliicoccus sp. Dog046]|uniref:SLC13 family permease n=1 Tax=Mammaliicoccus sp. Dog046 TaxID=3034233 RepID=UPI002B25B549|nr:SLC13 family permease [Mammaliicoccus sp. Dog046]WQK85765.1 SLC13 family permease [Mammaliicoccus sp. Dog046]
MTVEMIITLAITVVMIVLIMIDKIPFGAAPLFACLLLVIFGITDIKGAFAGFSNSTVIMLAEFMAIIAALQKTNFITAFKNAMFSMADKGGFKSYLLIILIVMLGCSLFGTGSTAYYVLTIGLLSTLPYTKKLPPSKVIMTAGFAANHPLIPFNTALQYGIVIAVLNSVGESINVSVFKFAIVNLFLTIGFLVNCIIQYKFLPDHPIADTSTKDIKLQENESVSDKMPKWKEYITYGAFAFAVVGMLLQSKIGDAGYAMAGLSVAVILMFGILSFTEIRDALSAPIILLTAGVIGVANALGSTGLTKLVGTSVADLLGNNVNAFVMILVFCILTSLLATLTGSTIGTVYVIAPLAITICTGLGLDPTAAVCAIVISGWCGHFLPIDGMPAMVLGYGKYTAAQFWKFTIPQYFIRLVFLTAGALLMFPV